MDIPVNLRDVCFLCWNNDISLHWENDIDENCCVSYKECFYKYTDFENIGNENLSQYLCTDCSNIIRGFHLLVQKSAKILQHYLKQKISNENQLPDSNSVLDSFTESHVNYDFQEISKIEIVRAFECYTRSESADLDCVPIGIASSLEHLSDSTENNFVSSSDSQNSCDVVERDSCSKKSSNVCHDIKGKSPHKDFIQYRNSTASRKVVKTPGICSYCSKIISGTYYLKLHEQTHVQNRLREVVCPKCNVKLYDKRSLYQHMRIHEENRVKKYKCEFCDKAFFSRGACNVHRRIHLGQMHHCPLCPKEFFRQLDLDKHMPQHSHVTLNSLNRKQTPRYYVHCKECDRKIASNRFNGHQATHMNNPYMRCTLCQKDFCSRGSGGKHMARVHKRKGGDYDDITFYYQNKESPRLSLLLKKQQEDVQPV